MKDVVMALTKLYRHARRPAPVALAVCNLFGAALAQVPQEPQSQLPTVVVTDHQPMPPASVAGFADLPLAEAPINVVAVSARQIEATGARRLADLLQFDASASDAYNAVGYWDYATVRGYVLDNRFNYRREGLPINAETYIALDNKEAVQILKGTSGLQAGVSAPGGLIEYTVKRPTSAPLRSARIDWNGAGSAELSVDLSDHLGEQGRLSYRLNLAAQHMGDVAQRSSGQRQLAALALDYRASADTLLQGEIEYSDRSQPSVPGASLVGTTLPAPDPRRNLNQQAWSLPVVLQGTTATLRWQQQLGPGWQLRVQGGTQRLTSQDRTAFPFGCTTPEGQWIGDRFCANGDYDLYDYRSENERRQTDAVQAQVLGKLTLWGVPHAVGLGTTLSHAQDRFQPQAFNWVGSQNLFAPTPVNADPTASSPNTQRDERSREWLLTDHTRWSAAVQSWIGVRQTHLRRSSVRTDGTEPSAYDQDITSPWAAASLRLSPQLVAYASLGRGAESQLVPNRPEQFTNAGVALAPMVSRQQELGLKYQRDTLSWQADLFDITRPASNIDACTRLYVVPCTGRFDGSQRHQGLELAGQWRGGPWQVTASASALQARRQGSSEEPEANGQRPTNVPKRALRVSADYKLAQVPGLSLNAHWSHEGQRWVLPDGSITLPAWNRMDAGLRYQNTTESTPTTWTIGITNLLDRRYWKESPYQFGHVYLFPGAQRQLRIAVQNHW
jgi:iron complex outermembrane receptor protein